MPGGDEAGGRLGIRIILAWPIALRVHASPARSAVFGSSSGRKTSSRSAKKNSWRVAPQPSVTRSLNSNPARHGFSKSHYHFSSAVTSIVRNCRKLKNRSPLFCGRRPVGIRGRWIDAFATAKGRFMGNRLTTSPTSSTSSNLLPSDSEILPAFHPIQLRRL